MPITMANIPKIHITTFEVELSFEGPEAHGVNKVSSSRLALMECFRSPFEEDLFRAHHAPVGGKELVEKNSQVALAAAQHSNH